MTERVRIWIRSAIRALIGGGAGGIVSAFANMGIKPEVFNLQAGIGDLAKTTAAASTICAILALAMYLQRSPLPEEEPASLPIPPIKAGEQ